MYVTDEIEVTNNTLSALSAVARIGKKCVVMVYPKYFGIWEKALKETYEGYEDGF